MNIKIISSIVLSSLLCLTGCGASYSSEELATRTAAPLERKWDMDFNDNPLVFDFDPDWGSPYRFFLNFYPISGQWTEEESNELFKIVGGSTKIGASNQNISTTLAIVKAVSIPPDVGVIIPIHVKIEKIDDNHQIVALIKEYTINTAGTTVVTSGGAYREIAGADLASGHYQISINTTQKIKLPPNTGASLAIDRKRFK